MAAATIVFLHLALSLCALCQTASSTFGPGNCLRSRVDVVPCNFFNINNVNTPGANEYGEYFTRFEFRNGIIECKILKKNHQVNPIQASGGPNLVLTFFSPNYFTGQSYKGRRYVDYNIQCGTGRIAYVSITDIDLEPKNCWDQSIGEDRCRDYLINIGAPFGAPEACGNDTSVDFNPSLQSSLRMLFRTSTNDHYEGFVAEVVCFQPDADTISSSASHGLSKRNVESVRPRDEGELQECAGSRTPRFLRIDVEPGAVVLYFSRNLYFRKSMHRRSISDIDLLYVFEGDKVKTYRTNALDTASSPVGPVPLQINGPGFLNIVGRRAYFHIYSPSDFALNREEQQILRELLAPHVDIARKIAQITPTPTPPDIYLPSDTSDVELEFPPGVGPSRGKRLARPPQNPPTFSNSDVRRAFVFENARNPVLRAAARSIIEDVEMKDSERLASLRSQFT